MKPLFPYLFVFFTALTGIPALFTACGTTPTAPSATPTPLPTNTPPCFPLTCTVTSTPTISDTPTVTMTATRTSSFTPTSTPTVTSTPTLTPTSTSTPPYSAAITFGSGTMNQPLGVAWATGGNLWVANLGNESLQEWTTAGVLENTITTFNTSLTFSAIERVATTPGGSVFVSETGGNRIDFFGNTGTYVANYTGTTSPTGMCVNLSGGVTLYVVDQFHNKAVAWSFAGLPPVETLQLTFANSGLGALSGGSAQGACVDSHGNIWIADQAVNRVVEYNSSGTYQKAITVAGNTYDVAVDGSDNVFVLNSTQGDIEEFDSSSNPIAQYGGGNLLNSSGLAIDSAGNYLYVTDSVANQIIGFKKN